MFASCYCDLILPHDVPRLGLLRFPMWVIERVLSLAKYIISRFGTTTSLLFTPTHVISTINSTFIHCLLACLPIYLFVTIGDYRFEYKQRFVHHVRFNKFEVFMSNSHVNEHDEETISIKCVEKKKTNKQQREWKRQNKRTRTYLRECVCLFYEEFDITLCFLVFKGE